MYQLFKRAVGNDPEQQVIHECRRCGTTLDRPSASCPYCSRNDVVTFVI